MVVVEFLHIVVENPLPFREGAPVPQVAAYPVVEVVPHVGVYPVVAFQVACREGG